jgi:hypothetical protein
MADNLRVLAQVDKRDPLIVDELKRLLALARRGELTAYFIFYRRGDEHEMSRIGYTDADACFSADVMRRRILDEYK